MAASTITIYPQVTRLVQGRDDYINLHSSTHRVSNTLSVDVLKPFPGELATFDKHTEMEIIMLVAVHHSIPINCDFSNISFS